MKNLKYLLIIMLTMFSFNAHYKAHIDLEYLNPKDNVKPGDKIEVVASLCTNKEEVPTTGDFYIKWDDNKLELLSEYDDIEYVRNNYFYFSNAKLSFFNKKVVNNTGFVNIVYEYTDELKAFKSDTCFNIVKLTFNVKDNDFSTVANVYTEEDYYNSLACYDTVNKEHVQSCYKVYDTKIPITIIGNDTEGSLTSIIVKDANLGNVLNSFPQFSSEVKDYTYEVENNVSSIRISSTCLNEGCTIKGNGKKSLSVGDNNFTLTTTVNGKKTTYNINVVRKGSKDASLKSIKLLDDKNEKITFEFNGKNSQYITVPNSVTKITFDTECQSKNCTVKEVDNTELQIGVNKIKLMVIAEDKNNTNIYTFYITRLEEELALLENLTIEGHELNEQFDSNKFEYSVNVKRNTKELKFNYVKPSDNYIVIIDGNTGLGKEQKDITLTIKGNDSSNVNVYTITTIPSTRGYVVLLYVIVPLAIIVFCLVMYLVVLNKKVYNKE